MNAFFASFFAAISGAISAVFSAPMAAVFAPVNNALAMIPQPMWRVCTIGLFVLTMLWVGLILRKEYVNLDAPSKSILHDLRLWTVLSMAPHIFIYLYF